MGADDEFVIKEGGDYHSDRVSVVFFLSFGFMACLRVGFEYPDGQMGIQL